MLYTDSLLCFFSRVILSLLSATLYRLGQTLTVVIYLLLIAIGFYFGKWLGAIGLVAIYFYFAQQRKDTDKVVSAPQNTDVVWAYQLLGVSQNADKQTIEKARKRLLNHYHPDKLGPANDEERRLAEKKVDEINRAYQAIKKHKEF